MTHSAPPSERNTEQEDLSPLLTQLSLLTIDPVTIPVTDELHRPVHHLLTDVEPAAVRLLQAVPGHTEEAGQAVPGCGDLLTESRLINSQPEGEGNGTLGSQHGQWRPIKIK